MAEKKINPKKQYKIEITKAVKVGRTWLRPGQRNVVSGATLESIKDDVSGFVEA